MRTSSARVIELRPRKRAKAAAELTDEEIVALAQANAVRRAAALEAWCRETAPAGYTFDEVAAARACAFFPRYLRHTKGKWYGQPFELEIWQRAIVRMAYGWKRPDGTRRFRIVYIEIPRKQGKTGLAAGNGLLLTVADGEPGAEVYSFANDTDQASIAFNTAVRMRALSPALRERTIAHKKAIAQLKTASSYKVLSSESGSKDGLNISGLIGDEIHALKDRLLYEVLHTATGAREQPLEWLITTAGSDPLSLCAELHDYAEKVRDRILDDAEFLPVVFGASKDADFRDPRVWAAVNPSLGVTVPVSYLRKEAKKAAEMPRYENTFKRLHLNIWTEQATRWIPIDWWDACSKGPVDPEALRGRPAFGGLDLSSKIDLSCLMWLFPPVGEEPWRALYRFFMPADNVAERVRRDRVPYDKWIKAGYIETTDGNIIDYDLIRRRAQEDGKRFAIRELGYDSWNAAHIGVQLTGDGFTMVEMRQGTKTMGGPSKDFEALVKAGRFDHGRNPVMRWMVSNTTVRTDSNDNVMPDKAKSTQRIDGVVATIMALGRALVRVEKPMPYANEGVVVV